MARRIPDLTRIQSLIGYKPTVSLDEIILRIADHFRDAGSPNELVPSVRRTTASLS
jgi:nucleoside-diphosphate-sugar epimerase